MLCYIEKIREYRIYTIIFNQPYKKFYRNIGILAFFVQIIMHKGGDTLNKQSQKQDMQKKQGNMKQNKNYENKERKNTTQCTDTKDSSDCKD